jgi:acyl-CoA thioesterase-2
MAALDDLVSLLDLEQLEVNLFRGHSQDRDRVRLYGGEVLAQALMAAGRTVDADRRVHSMHAYFLKLGDPKIPVVYDVDRIRDGRSFVTRRVVAVQHGQAIFNLAASFHAVETGPEHFDHMPEVPPADSLPDPGRLPEDEPETIDRQGGPHVIDALDFRHVGDPWEPGENRGNPVRDPDQDTWFRTRGRLPDDPLLHACVVAYASDLTLLGTATLPHPLGHDDAGFMMASLDHVMWFHRPFRADGWLLYHVHSPSAGAGRGFATGQIFCDDGTLAVSVAQEGLLRPMRAAR